MTERTNDSSSPCNPAPLTVEKIVVTYLRKGVRYEVEIDPKGKDALFWTAAAVRDYAEWKGSTCTSLDEQGRDPEKRQVMGPPRRTGEGDPGRESGISPTVRDAKNLKMQQGGGGPDNGALCVHEVNCRINCMT